MNDFYRIANEIAKIPDEEIKELSWEDRLNELVKFRAYLKEYHDSYGNEYLSFIEKIGQENDLEEKYILEYDFKKEVLSKDYDLELKGDWEKIASQKDLDLLESLSLLSFLQRQDYWDYEHMPLSYAIFDGTIDNILESVENHIDEENIEFLEIFVKK